jgi:hypothetical protein
MARAALAYPPLERKRGKGLGALWLYCFPLLESYLWLKEEGGSKNISQHASSYLVGNELLIETLV